MMRQRNQARLKAAKYGCQILACILCLLGIICITLSGLPSQDLFLAGCILMLLYGIMRIVGFFSHDLYCLAFQHGLASGVLMIVLSVIGLCVQQTAATQFPFGIGLLILLDGLLTLQTVKDAREFGIKIWQPMLVLALATSLLGFIMVMFWLCGQSLGRTLIGFGLIADSVMNLCVVQTTVSRLSARKHEI